MTVQTDPPVVAAASQPHMRLGERIQFAAGDIYGGGGGALMSVLYFFFLTDVAGIRPDVAGFIVAASKVWDAVSKPLMGQISDNTRTRWGRRRPYLMVGGFVLVLAYLLLWLPTSQWSSHTMKSLFALVSVLFYTSIATMINVPYSSMSTETTPDHTERSQLNLLRIPFATLSSATVFIVATGLMQAYKGGSVTSNALYAYLSLGFGIFFGIPVVLVGLFTRERTPVPVQRSTFSSTSYTEGFRVGAYRSLLGLYLCQALTMDVIATLLLAYATYASRVSSPIFMAIIIAVNLIAVVAFNTVFKHTSKNVLYGRLLPLAMVAIFGVALWPASWSVWPVYVLGVGLAAGIAGSELMSWVMFPDVCDAVELETGKRNAGSLSGMMSFCRSLCSAVLVLVIGFILKASGYVGVVGAKSAAGQPSSAVWAIRLILLVAVVVFSGIGWFLARRYPLTTSVVAQNAAVLADRRAA